MRRHKKEDPRQQINGNMLRHMLDPAAGAADGASAAPLPAQSPPLPPLPRPPPPAKGFRPGHDGAAAACTWSAAVAEVVVVCTSTVLECRGRANIAKWVMVTLQESTPFHVTSCSLGLALWEHTEA